jgi:hypothetical protein
MTIRLTVGGDFTAGNGTGLFAEYTKLIDKAVNLSMARNLKMRTLSSSMIPHFS